MTSDKGNDIGQSMVIFMVMTAVVIDNQLQLIISFNDNEAKNIQLLALGTRLTRQDNSPSRRKINTPGR